MLKREVLPAPPLPTTYRCGTIRQPDTPEARKSNPLPGGVTPSACRTSPASIRESFNPGWHRGFAQGRPCALGRGDLLALCILNLYLISRVAASV